MPPYAYGNPQTTDTAFDIVYSQYEEMSGKIIKIKTADLLWTKCINPANIDTSINPAAESVSYALTDSFGMGAFISAVGNNIPMVGISQGKISIPLEHAAIGSHIGDMEAEKLQYAWGIGVRDKKLAAMRKGSDHHIEKTFFYGSPSMGFYGYLNFPGVPVTPAAGKVREQTPEQNLSMFVDWYLGIVEGNKEMFKPDTLDLPFSVYSFLARQVFNINGTADKFTLGMINQALNDIAGKTVTIQSIRHLKGAAANGTDDRAKLYLKNDTENQVLPMHIPFTLKTPIQVPLGVDIFAMYGFGSYYELNPISGGYMDGI